MDESDRNFSQHLQWKVNGGARLDIFVSKAIWLGGVHDSRSHQPFVAVGPSDWESEDELTFFKNASEVNAFIEQLRTATAEAFGDTDASM